MPRPLDGVRVAITEHRYPEQLAQLLERLGASVFSCPLLKETPIEDSSGARRFISLCESTNLDYIVFYTGVGVDILFKSVTKPEIIAQSRILARGPKAVNALKRAGMRVDLVADSATTEGILETLSREELKGKTVLVQLYGQENTKLSAALQKRGATVIGVSIYSYTQASDNAAIQELVTRILDRRIDAITFTSATQVSFFFPTADTLADPAEFRKRMKKDVIVASVGDVTSRALRDAGVEPHVIPAEPKMGPMVKALGEFFKKESPLVFYPLFLELQDRRVLVVGGGTIAERKVESLLAAGAAVTLVAPAVTASLTGLANANTIELRFRKFTESDLDDAVLVISATDDPAAQQQIAAEARSRNIPINTVDQPKLCDFIVPAIVRKGDIVVAISTSGRSPALASALRAKLETVFTDDDARAARVLGEVRNEVHSRFSDPERRKHIFESIVATGILDWIKDCDDAAALDRVRGIIEKLA